MFRPSRWRRAAIRIAALTIIQMTAPTSAHHGFSGRYDFTRPLLLEGTITSWRSDRVHVEFEVEAGVADTVAATRTFAVLERIESRPLRLQAVAKGQRVRVEVDPILSRRIIANPPLPAAGERVRLVAYCRFSEDDRQGWLRVMAIERADGEVWSSSRRSYHETPMVDEQAAIPAHCMTTS